MKKNRRFALLLVPIVGIVLATQVPSTARAAQDAQDAPASAAEERLALGKRMNAADAERVELDKRLGVVEARIAVLEAALKQQATAAAAFQKSLTLVSEQGFTAGQNYKSRETLLGALRQLGATMENSTKAALKAVEAADPKKSEAKKGETKKSDNGFRR
jgi:hypothetical protein